MKAVAINADPVSKDQSRNIDALNDPLEIGCELLIFLSPCRLYYRRPKIYDGHAKLDPYLLASFRVLFGNLCIPVLVRFRSLTTERLPFLKPRFEPRSLDDWRRADKNNLGFRRIVR